MGVWTGWALFKTAGKPVRDVYRGQGGGYWISFGGWEVDAAAVREAVAKDGADVSEEKQRVVASAGTYAAVASEGLAAWASARRSAQSRLRSILENGANRPPLT
jgi:hypothetical protein